MYKYSEIIHKKYPVDGFEITGDLNKDANRWKEYMKIPYEYSELDISVIRTVMFSLSFGKQFIVHTLTDGVVEKVKRTIIENMPKEVPVFIEKSFLIEARHDKNLFDNIRSIGGFMANNEIILLIITDEIENNQYSQTISKSFDGRSLDELNMMYRKDSNNPYLKNMKERKDVFAFVLTFALMMEAERTSLAVETKNNKERNINKSKQSKKPDWIEKRVYYR